MSAMTGTSAQRLSLIPLASLVLAELIRRIEPERVAVSAYGLREGLLYRQMPEAMRHARPADRGLPAHGGGLGAQPGLRRGAERMDKAALRRQAGVRAPADPGGLSAARRELARASRLPRGALLRIGDPRQHRRASTMPSGCSSASRCSTATRRWRPPRRCAATAGLLSPARAAEAAVLGRAMRLGAMLSGSATGVLEHAALARVGRPAGPHPARPGPRVRRRTGRAAAADAGGRLEPRRVGLRRGRARRA